MNPIALLPYCLTALIAGSLANVGLIKMLDFFRSLRRESDDYREVFAEFSMVMIFLRAEHMAAKRGQARLRVVR